MALYCNDDHKVNILFISNMMIDVEAEVLGKKIYLTFFYGDPIIKLRKQVWEMLMRYGLQSTEPWFIIEDLNEITRNHEKMGEPCEAQPPLWLLMI